MHVVHSRGDKVFRGIVSSGALTSLVLLGLIGAFLLARGIEVFNTSGFKFLTGSNWVAGSEDGVIPNDFSIGPMIVGTAIVSTLHCCSLFQCRWLARCTWSFTLRKKFAEF
jgi:ABC-type phosphate transport system permease subunit